MPTADTSPVISHIVQHEFAWRRPAALMKENSAPTEILVSRWTDPSVGARHVSSTIRADYHTIAIALRRTDISLRISDHIVYEGAVPSGSIQVSSRGPTVEAILRSSSDFLHIHVPSNLLSECYTSARGIASEVQVRLVDPCFRYDMTIDQLVRALLLVDVVPSPSAQLYADGIGTAIITRLLDTHSNVAACISSQRTLGLPVWRLQRAKEFIEVHLGESMTLSDIARTAGISRMHFAAQFRAATGLRPHEYVLRRRVDRAKEMLSKPELPIAEVALNVGFQNQAHFTTVFRRFAGDTPKQWRLANCVRLVVGGP